MNSRTQDLIAYATILSAILYGISIAGLQVYISQSLEDMAAFVQNMNDSHSMMLLYGWPGIIATALIFPIIDYLYRASNQDVFARLIYVLIIIGLSFVLIAYMFHLGLTYFHTPFYLESSGAGRESMEWIIRTTIGLQDMFWLLGDILSFGGIAVLLLYQLRSGRIPAWLIITGVLAGISAALGSIGFIPAFKQSAVLGYLFIGGFSLFAAWEVLTGVTLLRPWRKARASQDRND